MARTSRSTGGISMRCPATPGTAGATTTRSALIPTNNFWMRTGAVGSWIPSTSCSTPGSSTTTATADHPFLGQLELLTGPDPQGAFPELLFCDNDTNLERLYGVPSSSPWPKDGINDRVVSGVATVNPERRGTKFAAWYRLTVAPGATEQVRLRLRPEGSGPEAATALGADFTRVEAQRQAEA